MTTRHSWVDAEAAVLGVKFRAAEIRGVHVSRRSPRELDAAKRAIAEHVRSSNAAASEILAGYRLLFERAGATGYLASPQALLEMALNKGLPEHNSVVDAYNIVSLRRLAVISAHDLDRVEGNPRIEMTKGHEVFHPLRADPITLPAGQWAGVADNHILCQMNCKQSELSKVTRDTTNLLVYVQGNPNTSDDYVEAALHEVCEEIVRINGGVTEYLPSLTP
jgi:DNA/RNA-binding domain of Phe-tRNA-synthetase-like protein